MLPFKLTMERSALDDWGRPEDIGAKTMKGDVRVAGKILFGSLDSPCFGGLYTATQGTYQVVYGFHEHATLLDGQLSITDDATGETVTYGPGDSWIIAKGQSVTWAIHSDHIRKSYLAAIIDG